MSATRVPKPVLYVHHTRDADGDVVCFFVDPQDPAGELRQSSPVARLRMAGSAVLDRAGRDDLGKYVLSTQNSDYEVQLSHERAEHLAWELGQVLPGRPQPHRNRLELARHLLAAAPSGEA